MGIISSFGSAPGYPEIDGLRCLRCGECAAICPAEALRSGQDGAITVCNDGFLGCIACGQCMMVCPNGSITVTGRNCSTADLLGLPPVTVRATAEQLSALMLARRSVRRFTGADVTREVVDRIISAAATAPMGIPPSEVGITALLGREKVAELAKDTVRGYAGMLKLMDNLPARWLGRLLMKKTAFNRFDTFILPLGRAFVEGEKQGRDYVLYNAPATLLFHTSPFTDAADAVIACTYAMLAAESEELGSCMIGCVAPILGRDKKLKEKYRIPGHHSPALVLILGHCAKPHIRAIRRRFLSVDYL